MERKQEKLTNLISSQERQDRQDDKVFAASMGAGIIGASISIFGLTQKLVQNPLDKAMDTSSLATYLQDIFPPALSILMGASIGYLAAEHTGSNAKGAITGIATCGAIFAASKVVEKIDNPKLAMIVGGVVMGATIAAGAVYYGFSRFKASKEERQKIQAFESQKENDR